MNVKLISFYNLYSASQTTFLKIKMSIVQRAADVNLTATPVPCFGFLNTMITLFRTGHAIMV